MNFRAVLFDLDGTLLDTLDDLADSMNAVLQGIGLAAHPVAAYRYFVGDGVENLVLRALPEGRRDGQTIAACVAAMRDQYSRRWADKTRPYEGVGRLLDELERRGLAMTILSNKPDDFTRLIASRLLAGWRFGAVRGARAGGAKKPDPAAALEIARELNIDPGRFVYLGDTNTDMRTALAAGMYPVGALWGFRSAQELCESGAKKLIEHPLDLLEIVDSPSP